MSDNKDTGKQNSNNNIHPLQFNAEHYDFITKLLHVTEVVDGEARMLSDEENNISYQAEIHCSSVPYLNEGDTVIVEVIDQSLVVRSRIRLKDESPNPQLTIDPDGNYVIDAPVGVKLKSPYGTIDLSTEGIKLKTPNAIIKVSAEGKIVIHGENIAFETEV